MLSYQAPAIYLMHKFVWGTFFGQSVIVHLTLCVIFLHSKSGAREAPSERLLSKRGNKINVHLFLLRNGVRKAMENLAENVLLICKARITSLDNSN